MTQNYISKINVGGEDLLLKASSVTNMSLLAFASATADRLTITKDPAVLQTADNWIYETRFMYTTTAPSVGNNYMIFSSEGSTSQSPIEPNLFFSPTTLSFRATLTNSTSIGGDNLFQPFTGWADKTVGDIQAVFDGSEYYLNIKKASDSSYTKYSIVNNSGKVQFSHSLIMLNYKSYQRPNNNPIWLTKTKITYNNGTVFFDGSTAIPGADYKADCSVVPYLEAV